MALRGWELVGIVNVVDRASSRLNRIGVNMGRLQAQATGFQKTMAGVGKASMALHRAGRSAQLGGLIATAGFGAAANKAADFDSQVTLAATQARDIGGNFDQISERADVMRQHILGAMQEFPARADEMAAATYEIFSGMNLMTKGIVDVDKGLRLLDTANKVSVAGGVDLATATSGLITVFNNFDPELKNVNGTLDEMFSIIQFGRLRFQDFDAVMKKVAPAARGAGNSLIEVGGAVAYLSQLIKDPGEVSTGIARALQLFLNPDVSRGLRERGVEVERLTGGLKPFHEIIKDIAETFPNVVEGRTSIGNLLREITRAGRMARTGRPGQGFIGTESGRRAISLAVQGVDQYLERQRQVEQANNKFQDSYEAMAASLGVRWGVFTNQLRAFVLMIGQEAIPVFIKVGEKVQGIINWFKNLDPESRKQLVTWGVWTGVIALVGGALLGITGTLAGIVFVLGTFAGALVKVIGPLIKVATKAGALGRAMMFLKTLGPISLVVSIAVIGGLQLEKLDRWIQDKAGISRNNPIRKFFEFDLMDLPGMFKKQAKKLLPQIRSLNKIPRTGEALRLEEQMGVTKPRTLAEKLEDARKVALAKRRQEESKAAADLAKKWQDYYDKIDGGTSQAAQDQKQYTEEVARYHQNMAQAIKDAHRQAVDQVDQAAQRLTGLWNELKAANTAAMGELFQGPWMTGEAMDLAKEWGVKPAIKDLQKDVDAQLKAFRINRAGLAKLIGMGAPKALVDELRRLGPQGQENMDAIMGATPAARQRYFKSIRQRAQDIAKATRIDFNAQLAQWETYGKNIMRRIVLGLTTEQFALDNYFKGYITGKFPGIVSELQAGLVADWKEQNPFPTRDTDTVPKPPMPTIQGGRRSPVTTNNNRGGDTIIHVGDPGGGGGQHAMMARRIAWTLQQHKRSVGQGPNHPHAEPSPAKPKKSTRKGGKGRNFIGSGKDF